ncbi:hypothetical protein CCZ01_09405 [Helicobacter monodelphidis]|uniref:replication initiation protein n=1 Tax=Helicobacter sp. 15-1451 TaxID=2004995 RepID=UPI000DCD0D31|nr:replication initiation protein [Helicobacter sp. 15-1451]RAX56478.1 hypothetical protein CCZ01_09405 [Helicobacter sp. 15-1451]
MNQIVKYHNDFNKIKLPSFNELQQNLLFGIISKIREKGDSIFEFSATELNEFVKERNYTKKELFQEVSNLKTNFFKADFTIIEREGNKVAERTINLFQDFTIFYEDNKDTHDFVKFEKIRIQVNPTFQYLLNGIISNFTRFELVEFISLSGKYTKTLYRLLKQFRSTGYLKMEWEEFKRVIDIPENKTMGEIDKFILKPALKELTKPRTLFDIKRIPFENLSYTKIKGKGRGRGGNVIGIEFTFTIQEPLELKEETIKKESQELTQEIPPEANQHQAERLQECIDRITKSKRIPTPTAPIMYAYVGIHLEGGKIINAYKSQNVYSIEILTEDNSTIILSFATITELESYIKEHQI